MEEVATKEQLEVDSRSFTLKCSSVQVTATLRNPTDAWDVTPIDDGLVCYDQAQGIVAHST